MKAFYLNLNPAKFAGSHQSWSNHGSKADERFVLNGQLWWIYQPSYLGCRAERNDGWEAKAGNSPMNRTIDLVKTHWTLQPKWKLAEAFDRKNGSLVSSWSSMVLEDYSCNFIGRKISWRGIILSTVIEFWGSLVPKNLTNSRRSIRLSRL